MYRCIFSLSDHPFLSSKNVNNKITECCCQVFCIVLFCFVLKTYVTLISPTIQTYIFLIWTINIDVFTYLNVSLVILAAKWRIANTRERERPQSIFSLMKTIQN